MSDVAALLRWLWTMRGRGSASSTGSGWSQGASSGFSSIESMSYSYDPNTQTFIMTNVPLGMNAGTADGTSQSLISSENFQGAVASDSSCYAGSKRSRRNGP